MFAISGRSIREAGVCSDRQNIYVLGGKPDDLAAHKFDVCLGIWVSLPEMIRPRRCTGNIDSFPSYIFALKTFKVFFYFIGLSASLKSNQRNSQTHSLIPLYLFDPLYVF